MTGAQSAGMSFDSTRDRVAERDGDNERKQQKVVNSSVVGSSKLCDEYYYHVIHKALQCSSASIVVEIN